MCYHVDETFSWETSERRHRSEAADDPSEEPRESIDDPRGEAIGEDGIEESEPPAEPRAPADD